MYIFICTYSRLQGVSGEEMAADTVSPGREFNNLTKPIPTTCMAKHCSRESLRKMVGVVSTRAW